MVGGSGRVVCWGGVGVSGGMVWGLVVGWSGASDGREWACGVVGWSGG